VGFLCPIPGGVSAILILPVVMGRDERGASMPHVDSHTFWASTVGGILSSFLAMPTVGVFEAQTARLFYFLSLPQSALYQPALQLRCKRCSSLCRVRSMWVHQCIGGGLYEPES
jgi:hypothetical protein